MLAVAGDQDQPGLLTRWGVQEAHLEWYARRWAISARCTRLQCGLVYVASHCYADYAKERIQNRYGVYYNPSATVLCEQSSTLPIHRQLFATMVECV